MSWSVQFENPINTAETEWIGKVMNAAVSPVEPKEEVAAASNKAKELVVETIASGFVGKEGKQFNVTANGHSNPGNEPKEGWSNDYVAINIYQVSE